MPPKRNIDLQKVVQTAVALADEHGFENVMLASVAEQLGIRIPSLYNHVSGLPGLRYQMTLWGVRQLTEQLRRAAVGKSSDEAVFSLAHAYRASAHAHPGLYMATLRAPKPDEPELIAEAEQIIEVLLAVLRPYGFDGNDSLHVIRALRSVLHGFVGLEIVGGFGLNLDCDESFRQLVELFIQGLHARRNS